MELRPAAPGLSRRSLLRGGLALGAGLALGGALTGCAPSTAPSGATTVRLWSWLTGMDKYVAAFNAAQRDVFVDFSVIASGLQGGYAQQTNAIRAHNAPDLLHVEYQALPQIVTTGGLRELTADVADLAPGFAPAAWEGVRPDGRTWGLPWDLAPMAFYYRKDLFDRHGVDVPTTWDEFAETARAVRTADPDARVTTFPLNDGSFFAGMCWGAGDPWWSVDGDAWRVDITGPGTLRTAGYWQKLISDGLVSTMSTSNNQDWSASMHDGRLWGLLGASWSINTLVKNIPKDTGRWAVAPMPTWDRRAPANGIQGGTTFGISAESSEPEAALRFLRWLSTDPAVPRLGATFTTPFPSYEPNREVARSAYKGGYFTGPPVYDVLDTAAARVPDWTWGPNALGLFSTVVDEIGGVGGGRGSLTDALQRIQTAAVTDMRGRGLAVVEGSAA